MQHNLMVYRYFRGKTHGLHHSRYNLRGKPFPRRNHHQ